MTSSVAKPPSSVWLKPVACDTRTLFKAIAKTVVHGVTGKWGDAAIDTSEILTAIGVKSDPAELAWLLVSRALVVAIADLTKDVAGSITVGSEDVEIEFAETLASALDASPPTLDPTFFAEPGGGAFLRVIGDTYGDWLKSHGADAPTAAAVVRRLPSHFVFALHLEWRRNAKLYAPIVDAIETPFTHAKERERAWMLYQATLDRQADESMLGEPFSLRQLFVPLRAYYVDKADVFRSGNTESPKRVVVSLEDELDTWIKSDRRDDAIRVVSGGPGSGKSSFARLYASKLGREGKRVLFVPLHQFDPAGDLPDAIGEFVRASATFPHNPLDLTAGDQALLIIFDGLDELAMQGRLANEVAQAFVREVQRQVGLRNHTAAQLRVIITGRELVIQSNAAEFRKPGVVLHVLPYYVPDAQRNMHAWRDEHGLLKRDDRQIWWKRYGHLTGHNFNGLPAELTSPGLAEVTGQPLLNYLVALSYTRGELTFNESVSLNAIYEDLIRAVYERAYAGHTHLSIRGMEYAQFIRVMEEIGLAAWHGDGRTTTVREIEEHCSGSGLGELLDTFQEGAKAGVTRLLTAFYFRQHGNRRDGERTFEFTHKSFGEYLISRRIVRAVEVISDELELRRAKVDRGWSERDALKHWILISGPTPLDHYLGTFLQNELASRKSNAEWQAVAERLLTYAVTNGMPVELVEPRPRYRDEERLARNAEEALLVVLNACARATGKVSKIGWPDVKAAGAWIARLQGQRTGPDNPIALNSLSLMDFSKCILHMRDFYGANIERSIFHYAEMYYFVGSELRATGADFTGARLHFARLDEADLRECTFAEATLWGTSLQNAYYAGARFDRTTVSKTDAHLMRKRGLQVAKKAPAGYKDAANVSGVASPDPENPRLFVHRAG